MNLRSAGMRFWVISLAALITMGVTASLGRWQLSRASEKESLQAAVLASSRLPALDAAALLASKDPLSLVHRVVRVRGTWLDGQTVYLDNRPMRGMTGFIVCTPLRLVDSGAVILVQRGWIQRNFMDRHELAPVQTPPGTVEVEGRLAATPSRIYAFDSKESGPIRQNLDLAAFRGETRLPLMDPTLVQTGAASEGLLREWPPFDAGVDKHYGYAAQWFGLAALIAILYVWFQFIQPRRRAAA